MQYSEIYNRVFAEGIEPRLRTVQYTEPWEWMNYSVFTLNVTGSEYKILYNAPVTDVHTIALPVSK